MAVAARSARAAHALETRTAGTGGAGCHAAVCLTRQHAVGARRRGGAAPCRQAPSLAGGPAHGRRGASAPGVQPGCSASTRHVRGAVREGHAPSGTSCAATSTHSNCASTRRCFLGVRSVAKLMRALRSDSPGWLCATARGQGSEPARHATSGHRRTHRSTRLGGARSARGAQRAPAPAWVTRRRRCAR